VRYIVTFKYYFLKKFQGMLMGQIGIFVDNTGMLA